jgi:hypothetical protein
VCTHTIISRLANKEKKEIEDDVNWNFFFFLLEFFKVHSFFITARKRRRRKFGLLKQQ